MPQSQQEKIEPRIEVRHEECKGCELCVQACPVDVIEISSTLNGRGYHYANYLGHNCTGCGVCFYACPEPGAITVYKKIKNRKAS